MFFCGSRYLLSAITEFAGQIPIFGICLGQQSIGAAFGGEVVRAQKVMHGKTSQVHHHGKGVFTDLPSPLTATRYHSLVVDAPVFTRVPRGHRLDRGRARRARGNHGASTP